MVLLGGVLAVAVAAPLVLYVERLEIAARLGRAWLRDHGVIADLRVEALSSTRLRARVRLGSADHPDFEADAVDVDYRIITPWPGKSAGLEVRSVHLVRPRLAGRFDGRRLSFGALQPIIDEVLAHPQPPDAVRPAVTVDMGRLRLETLWGTVRVEGSATSHTDGAVDAAGTIAPGVLSGAAFRLQSRGGPARLHLTKAGLDARLTLDIDAAAFGGAAARHARVDLVARWTAAGPAGPLAGGPIHVDLSAVGADGTVAGARGRNIAIRLTGDGTATADASRQSFLGTVQGSATLAEVAAKDAQTRGLSGRFTASDISASHDAGRLPTWRGAVDLSAAARSLHTDMADMSGLSLAAKGRYDANGLDLEGALGGRAAATPAGRRTLAARLPSDGEGGPSDLKSQVMAATSDARLEARSVRLQASDKGVVVSLPKPITLTGNTGAKLTLGRHGDSPFVVMDGSERGAADLAVVVDKDRRLDLRIAAWSVQDENLRARGTLQALVDAGQLRGAKVAGGWSLAAAPGTARFILDNCASIAVKRIAMASVEITAFQGGLCPGKEPLITVDRSGWRTAARLDDLQAMAAGVQVEGGGASLAVAGDSSGPRVGEVTLDRAGIQDGQRSARFAPLQALGSARLQGTVWRGNLSLTAASGHPIATVAAWHDLAGGIGRADLDASHLVFAAGGFQPAEISPTLAFARDVTGQAAATGWAAWRAGTVTSGGGFSARDLAFRSPLGEVKGLAADISATSLAPLVVGPATVTVARISGVVDIDTARVRFTYRDDRLGIDEASAGVAKGRVSLEPLALPLGGPIDVKGVVNLNDIDVGELLAASSLADSIQMRAVIDGRLPFVWNGKDLRLDEGHVAATGPGRLSISRAALTGAGAGATSAAAVAGADVNTAQDLAYQALDNLAFDALDASVRTTPGGRLGVLFHIKGRHDPPTVQRAVIKVADLLNGSAFRKPLTLPSGTPIDLTLDTSLNFNELLSAFGDIWAGREPTVAPKSR